LIGVLGEVSKDDHDLILHIETNVAVITKVLALRDDESVTGEDDGTAHFSVVGEGECLHVFGGDEGLRCGTWRRERHR